MKGASMNFQLNQATTSAMGRVMAASTQGDVWRPSLASTSSPMGHPQR
jgi:hypothetical protein